MLQDKYPTRYLPNVGRQVMQEVECLLPTIPSLAV
jgi:hypothetical protein